MTSSKRVTCLFILISFISKTGIVLAQAPNISYVSPQIYTATKPIAPLIPTNTGGPVPDGQVTTFAGTGVMGAANGTGATASFFSPVGVSVDGTGTVYVGDDENFLIRKIYATGIVSTLAGSGAPGNNNSTGTFASFDHPFGVAVDRSDNVYVADEGNNLIRKISPTGVVTTLAGSGAVGSTDNNIGILATFNHPDAVAVDGAGNVYVAEGASNLIRKITPQGSVTTLAGSGASGWADGNGRSAVFNSPQGIAADVAGNVYVADSRNNRIRKITPGGIVTTIAGNSAAGSQNGLAAAARFNYPYGVAVDGVGNVYVSDQLNNVIRKITATGIVTTLAGSGLAGSTDGIGVVASFNTPSHLTVDPAGNLYVADSFNNKIRKVVTTGFSINQALPAGLNFDPTTGIISGTPTVTSPPVTYTITAYNTSGFSMATVVIQVLSPDNFLFNPMPVKTFCDADFDPGATAILPISYTSSNAAVATVTGSQIHITGSGTTNITATDGPSSGTQILTVNAPVIPTIVISPSVIDTCQGATVIYTANITNGGLNPAYQWQVNGQNQGVNNPQFTIGNLNNGDKVTCTLTSNAVCRTVTNVTSGPALFTIYQPANVSVSITSSVNGSVCSGTAVSFTAIPFTPDNHPAYQWKVNGFNAGANSPVFTSNTLNNGDLITCVMTTSGKCLINPTATSNTININVSAVSTCIIIVPNAFSPNGDGVNDLWNITALQSYPNCTVAIYDRYGNIIYRSINYPKAWDGTLNGRALPGGTYYYVIDPKNGKKLMAGYVTILR